MSRDRPPKDAISAIVSGAYRDPFAVLGPHRAEDGLAIRAFVPDAEALTVVKRDTGEQLAELERLDNAGFFSGVIMNVATPPDYRLRAHRGSDQWEFEDPYRFSPLIGELDNHLLAEGSHKRLWERLGAHTIEHQGVIGTHFAVWAPSAKRVSV